MTTAAPPANRPARLRPRYSLRVLLVAFTAFAIGFPIWYRWPYEEVERGAQSPDLVAITSWQRQWGGGRLKHGAFRIAWGKQPVQMENYSHGLLDGPCQYYLTDGTMYLEGNYKAGQRDGLWTETIEAKTSARTQWSNGRLDGLAEQFTVPGLSRSDTTTGLVFANGRLISINKRPVDDSIAQFLSNGTVNDDLRAANLRRPGASLSANGTLTNVVEELKVAHDVHVRIDLVHVDPNRRLGLGQWRDLTPGACLSATLEAVDLTSDFRYGQIWITTPEGAAKWHDPTGVAEIVPPKGSALAKAWHASVPVKDRDWPLSLALEQLAADFDVAIDTTQVSQFPRDKDLFVSLDECPRRFGDLLGLMLWQCNSGCELRGETLVILRQ